MSRRIIQRLVDHSTSLLLLFLLLAAISSPARAAGDGIMRVKSAVPMSEAITRIKADIEFWSSRVARDRAERVGVRIEPVGRAQPRETDVVVDIGQPQRWAKRLNASVPKWWRRTTCAMGSATSFRPTASGLC